MASDILFLLILSYMRMDIENRFVYEIQLIPVFSLALRDALNLAPPDHVALSCLIGIFQM